MTRTRIPARRAFTLLEIMIVIALLGGIIAIVASNLEGTFGRASAELEKTKVTQSFDTALLQYRMNVGSYPSSDDGLKSLLVAPDGKADRWKGPYLKDDKALVDGYGNAYGYRFPGTRNPAKYDLWSFGPDGKDGTADDIGNW